MRAVSLGLRRVLLQPLNAQSNPPIYITVPAVPTLVFVETHRGALLSQRFFGLLSHLEGANLIMGRVVDEKRTTASRVQRRQGFRFKDGHGDIGSGDRRILRERNRVCRRTA